MITSEQLAKMYSLTADKAAPWVPILNAVFERFEINAPHRQAMFLAQFGVESMCLQRLSENLNYSAQGLVIFNTKTHIRFTTDDALKYAALPRETKAQGIANRAYADRNGNGNEASGDGWRYHGRGLPQLTFKDNYRTAGAALGLDLINNPDLLLQPEHAAAVGGWYWKSHGCNELADKADFVGVTRAINGGLNGLEDRQKLLLKVREAMV